MKHYVGLDVSLEESSIAVISESGRVVREAKALSEPGALVDYLSECGFEIERIGLEAGPLSQWLHEGLRAAGLPVVCLETRQVKAALSAQVEMHAVTGCQTWDLVPAPPPGTLRDPVSGEPGVRLEFRSEGAQLAAAPPDDPEQLQPEQPPVRG